MSGRNEYAGRADEATSGPSRRGVLGAAATAPLMFSRVATAQDFNARPANATSQRPAFADQTRAPMIADDVAVETTVFARGLVNPWGMALLPDGRWLVTERPGRLSMLDTAGRVSVPIRGVPEVDARGQGGLLDVAVRDDFAETRRIWLSFAEPRGDGLNATAVATGVLAPDGATLTAVKVIFRQDPPWRSTMHFGSRLVFDREGMLFVTLGERSVADARPLAQDVGTLLGKVVRIGPDGGPAPGNPALPGGRAEIWSIGHRNVQAAALGPDGALWTVEHGARGGDELNRPEAGKNYGWPTISYGLEYNGQPIGPGRTARAGLEQPLYFWDPVIAPSGMAFYDGDLIPSWRGSLLVGALAGQALVRLTLDGTKVTGEARYFQGRGRIRDVAVAPDGAVMLLTDAANGTMLRVAPKG